MVFEDFYKLTEELADYLRSNGSTQKSNLLYPIWIAMLPTMTDSIRQASPAHLTLMVLSLEVLIANRLDDFPSYPPETQDRLLNITESCCDLLSTALKHVTASTPLSVKNKFNLYLILKSLSFDARTKDMLGGVLKSLMTVPMNKDFDFQHALFLKKTAHHLGIHGDLHFYQHAKGMGLGKIELMGLDSRFFLPVVRESFKNFISQLKSDGPHLSELSRFIDLKIAQCLQLSERHSEDALIESAWANYQAGSPQLIKTGHMNHCFFIVLTQTHCCFGNRGDSPYEPGFIAFNMTKPISFELFKKLIKISHGKTDTPIVNAQTYFEKQLPKTLGLILDREKSLISSGQKYGNCALSSLKIAVKGLMHLYFDDKERTHLLYKQWSVFDRNAAFEAFWSVLKSQPQCYLLHEQFIGHWLYEQHDIRKIDEVTRAIKLFGTLPLTSQINTYEAMSSQLKRFDAHNSLTTLIDTYIPSFLPLLKTYQLKETQEEEIKALQDRLAKQNTDDEKTTHKQGSSTPL